MPNSSIIREVKKRSNASSARIAVAKKLAFEADLHRAYVGQIERGEKNIGVQNFEKIAKVLNIKMSKLLGE